MVDITYRNTKGSELTHTELDNNFLNLDTRVAKSDKARIGFADYQDTATTSSPISLATPGTWYKLTNNTSGSLTLTSYLAEGVTSLWDSGNNQLDFTELSLGDQLGIRISLSITTSAANQEVDLRLSLGIGDPSAYTLNIGHYAYKTAGTYSLIVPSYIYMGNTITRDNPAEIQIKSDATGTVVVDGFYIRTFLRGEAV